MRSSLYSLSAGSEHPANCQDPHKAFARGPMTPTVVGVGILQVLACGEGGIPIRPAPSCERIGGPMPTQSKTASSTSQDFPKAQSRSSGLFRRDLQPQNGHFDVPRFPTSPIAPQACFAAICGQKRPLRRSEISHKPNRVPQACFAAICSHKTATSTFRDFQKAMPRSSGLFRRVLQPKTASSTFRDFYKSQTAFRLVSPRFAATKRPLRRSEISRITADKRAPSAIPFS